MTEFQVDGESVTFWLRVKPRASRDKLAEDAAGGLKLEIQAPPVEGEANEACVRYFARKLRLPQSCVEILSGRRARRKLMQVTCRPPDEIVAQISALASLKVFTTRRQA